METFTLPSPAVPSLSPEVPERRPFDSIIYSSPKMRAVLDLVRRVAPTRAAVYISGESGTGKELISRALHDTGAQRTGSFVARSSSCALFRKGRSAG